MTLNFTGSQQWEQLPKYDRDACCHAIAQLMMEILSNTFSTVDRQKDDER